MDGIILPREGCRIVEVECRAILNKSGLADWAVNCYAGCEHGCAYCYARFATRFSHSGEAWGSFVDVKVNAPQALAREAKRKRVGRVFLSSVCDGWQPIEARYELTRQCLQILLQYGYPITILTKSTLAGRDFDLLASKDGVEFGVTLTTLDEGLGKLIEPKSSPPAKRLALMEEAMRRGIRTYAFLGPLMPYLFDTEENLRPLLEAVKQVGVEYFYIDMLNPRYGVWPSLKGLLQEHFPHLTERYRRILFDNHARTEYSGRLMSTVNRLTREQRLSARMKLCF